MEMDLCNQLGAMGLGFDKRWGKEKEKVSHPPDFMDWGIGL